MIWYLFILAIVMLISYFTKEDKRLYTGESVENISNISNVGLIAIIAVLILFEGLRSDTVGVDTAGYCRYYTDHTGKWWTMSLSLKDMLLQEPGFILIYRIAAIFGDNYAPFLLTASCFCVIPALLSIKDTSANFTASLLVYMTFGCYLFGFAGIRQGIAISIYVIAYKYLFQKNFIKYALVVLIAALFHKSILLTLPIFFVCKLKYSTKNIILVTIVAAIFGNSISSLLSFSTTIDGRYSYYLEETAEGSGQLLALASFAVTAFFIYGRRYISSTRLNVYDSSLMMMLISTAIYLVVTITESNTEINRFAQYFQLGAIFLTAEFVNACKTNQKTILNTLISLFFIAYYFVYVYKIGGIRDYTSSIF